MAQHDASTTLCVVSPHAAQLRALLAEELPAAVRPHFFDCAEAVDEAGLQADIALGAPDELASILPRMPRLRWVQSTWAGVTPLIELGRADYQLSGVKGLFGSRMSEYVLGWLLARERRMLDYAASESWAQLSERSPSDLRLGIAGVGAIGSAVAERCAPFFAEVVGLNSDGRGSAGCARCFPVNEIEAFANGLDALVGLLPHTSSTSGLLGERVFAAMNDGATLVNAGRGNALDLPAALSAVSSGRLGFMVLDVFDEEPVPDEDPLWQHPRVAITSHSAAPTENEALAGLFLKNLALFLCGEDPGGLIDFARGY